MKKFLKRKLVDPLTGFLLQGISPEKLGWAVALGFTIAMFPVFGSTTLLCAAAALVFRLNMPAIQLVNYFSYPLQFMLFLPYMKLGGYLFSAPAMPYSVTEIFGMFKTDIFHAIALLWTSTWHAMVAWAITALPAAVVIYFILVPLFRKIISKKIIADETT